MNIDGQKKFWGSKVGKGLRRSTTTSPCRSSFCCTCLRLEIG